MSINKSKNRLKILDLLKIHTPAFQLKSGSDELKSSEQFFSIGSQETEGMSRACHASSLAVLEFISETIMDGDVSLETGGGWSTCVFAACAKKHICINPDITANELIKRFIEDNNINIRELIFRNETSDIALPALDKNLLLDIALIDGNHSFPIPIIDWHYMDLHLKKGSIILIDDTHIRSVGVLSEYLSLEKNYEKIAEIGNADVFKKICSCRVWGWADQEFNKIYNIKKNHAKSTLMTRFINRLIRNFRNNFNLL